MNRWHPPKANIHQSHGNAAGSTAALEMQLRALREALDRAVKAVQDAQVEAHALRESLLCERLRHADLQMRFKQLQQFHNATTVGETECLQKENRRLRTLLAEAAREAGQAAQSRPAAERIETADSAEEPEISFGT